jgi:hypothetical protein
LPGLFLVRGPMALEEEMKNEIQKLEREIAAIDEEMQKLSTKIVNFLNIKKKKEHDLRVLRETFEIIPTTSEEIQLTLEPFKQRI